MHVVGTVTLLIGIQSAVVFQLLVTSCLVVAVDNAKSGYAAVGM